MPLGGALDIGGAGRAPGGAPDMGGAPGRADMGGAGGAPGGAPDMGGALGGAPAGAAAPSPLGAKVLWEQLGLAFLLDLSIWKQLVPLLQVVLGCSAPGGWPSSWSLPPHLSVLRVALFLKLPPTLAAKGAVGAVGVAGPGTQGLLLLVQGEGVLFQLDATGPVGAHGAG